MVTPPEGAGPGSEEPVVDLRDRRIEGWELFTEIPLLLASLVFLVAVSLPITAPGIPKAAKVVCWVTVVVLWVVFILDYVARLVLARRRAAFVYSRSLDLAVVVLPVLRPVRAVRQLTSLSLLQERLRYGFEIQVMVYAGLGTALLGFTAALAELAAERNAKGSTIQTIGEAVWWSATEITGSGYGDVVPVTFWGRTVSIAVSLVSLALFGVVTGTFASWFTGWYRSNLETAAHARENSALLEETLAQLRTMTAHGHTAPKDRPPDKTPPPSPD